MNRLSNLRQPIQLLKQLPVNTFDLKIENVKLKIVVSPSAMDLKLCAKHIPKLSTFNYQFSITKFAGRILAVESAVE